MLFAATIVKTTATTLAIAIAIWPAMATAASTTVTANVCRTVIAPTTLIAGSSSPTTNPTIDLSGSSEPNAVVDITENGNSLATILADTTGQFGVTIGLDLGDDSLVAVAQDSCGHQAYSPNLTIRRNPVPPLAPTVFEPQSGASTSADNVLVSGQTDALATVTVYRGDQTLATLTAGASGAFATTVPLAIGSNELQLSSTNSAGSSSRTDVISVTRIGVTSNTAPVTPIASSAPLATPVIISPSDQITITAASALITVQAQAGSIVEVFRGDSLRYTLTASSAGLVTFDAGQVLGANVWTARANYLGSRTSRSSAITIERVPSPMIAPVIVSPNDNAMLPDPWAQITGSAEPASTLQLFDGRRPIARIIISSEGTFNVRVPISLGTNTIYAESSRGDIVRRSGVLLLAYSSPTISGFGQKVIDTFQAILGTVLGVALYVSQSTGDLVSFLAATPGFTVLVMGLALIALTFTRGLLGFELLLMLLPFIRWWGRFIEQPSAGRIITISDSVTGQPLPFVLATTSGSQAYSVISDFAGHLHVPTSVNVTNFRLTRPGYMPAGVLEGSRISLEPAPGPHSLSRLVLDISLGLLAWVLLLLATLTSYLLVIKHPTVITSALALIFSALMLVNLVLLASLPHLKWGRIADSKSGRMVSGAKVLLKSSTGEVISSFLTRSDGRYTLHAPVGEYEISISQTGYKTYFEHLSVRWRDAYIGFSIKLDRE